MDHMNKVVSILNDKLEEEQKRTFNLSMEIMRLREQLQILERRQREKQQKLCPNCKSPLIQIQLNLWYCSECGGIF